MYLLLRSLHKIREDSKKVIHPSSSSSPASATHPDHWILLSQLQSQNACQTAILQIVITAPDGWCGFYNNFRRSERPGRAVL